MGDGFIVDEPLFSTAESYIESAISDISDTYEIIDEVGTRYPNGLRCTESITYACSAIQASFNYIIDFRGVMATTRTNLASLDEAFAAAQKKEEEGLLSSFFDRCGAEFKMGFSSLLNGEGFERLLGAFSRSGATLLVLGNALLNKRINTASQPFIIIADMISYGTLKLIGGTSADNSKKLATDVLRGEFSTNFLDYFYKSKYGQNINDKSYIKFDDSRITNYEKTKLTKLNESILSHLYRDNHSKANKALNTSARDMKSFDAIFNDHYGGAQGDPIAILGSYGSERRMLNDTSLKGQKAQMLYSKIKEYYPNASFDDAKKIAQAYNESGCSYMAVADAFTLHASSQKDGEKIFKQVVGKNLYSSDGKTKSANVETMALDLFLYKSKNENKSINDILENKNDDNAANTLYMSEKHLQEYFKEKNVKVYNTYTIVKPDEETHHKVATDIVSFENKHDDAVYILSASNFNMVSKDTSSNSNAGDGALSNSTSSGNKRKYIHNVGDHAMFVTGYNDDSVEVSSWAGKYDVPITSTYSNKSYIKGDPDMFIVGYDFDYSDVLK